MPVSISISSLKALHTWLIGCPHIYCFFASIYINARMPSNGHHAHYIASPNTVLMILLSSGGFSNVEKHCLLTAETLVCTGWEKGTLSPQRHVV
jgi:hypothetical protein